MEVTAKDWLDSLSTGTCEVNALLKGITELLRRSPEEGWELLSIVDQYYRRGKITAPVFATLKAHLQGLLVGKSRPEVSVPMPRARRTAGVPPDASATTPVLVETPGVATPGVATAAAAVPDTLPVVTTPRPAAPSVAVAVHGAQAAAAPGPITVGSILRDRYRVLGVLGHGGTGTVFEALDLYRLDVHNGRGKVAIKVLHPNVIRRAPLFTELRREFQRLQLLSHPHIVRVHEFDRDGETAFFTMEHLSGVLLSRVIAVRESAPVPRDHAFAMLRDICGAIAYAHGRGLVHGDVSPGNIFICNDGDLRVLDFGSNGVATPSFASCQVLEGAAPDARDDVYGLACIAYILLAGSHPFEDHTALNARASRLEPKRPSGLGSAQWKALRAGLHFERDDRPADVTTWAALLNPRPSLRRLPALPTVMSAPETRRLSSGWLAIAGLLIVVAAGGWWVNTHLDVIKLAFAGLSGSKEAPPAAQPSPQSMPTESAAVLPDAAPAPVTVRTVAPLPAARERATDEREAAARAPPDVSAVTVPPVTVPPITVPPVAAPTPAPPAAAAPRAVPSTVPTPVAGSPVAPTSPGSRARLELTTDNVDATPSDGVVRVTVRRTRSLRGEVSFNWWTESGTAKPGRDFTPVASHVEHIEDGKSAVNLSIPLLIDPQRRQTRSFYVVIDAADPTAAVGPRTLAMVTIPEPD